jgi:hypothetical protein
MPSRGVSRATDRSDGTSWPSAAGIAYRHSPLARSSTIVNPSAVSQPWSHSSPHCFASNVLPSGCISRCKFGLAGPAVARRGWHSPKDKNNPATQQRSKCAGETTQTVAELCPDFMRLAPWSRPPSPALLMSKHEPVGRCQRCGRQAGQHGHTASDRFIRPSSKKQQRCRSC